MESAGLPFLLDWVAELENAVETRQEATHRLALYCTGGVLRHAET